MLLYPTFELYLPSYLAGTFSVLMNWCFDPLLPCTGPWWILLFEGGTSTSRSPEAAGQTVGHQEHQQWNKELDPHGDDQAVWWWGRCVCGSGGFWNIQQLPGHSVETKGSWAAVPQPKSWATEQGSTSRRRPGSPGGNVQTFRPAELQ